MKDFDEFKKELIIKYDISDHIEPNVIVPSFKNTYGIILIVGSSGSGKSTILKNLGITKKLEYDANKIVIDNFKDSNAESLLLSTGLRSIPTWFRPMNTLSNGELHRAECALAIDQKINCIDEFTSVVDRNTAKSLSVALRKQHQKKEPLYIATCHRDVEKWLCPDFIYDTDKSDFSDRRFLRRPKIQLSIKSSSHDDWKYFSKHHYLDSTMSKATHCYTAYIDDIKVAFMSVIHGTGRDHPTYWRDCRLVVLPEWQGVGIGTKLSDYIADLYTSLGHKYFAKTSHVALGGHREKSSTWKATSNNKKNRMSYITGNVINNYYGKGRTERDAVRICYSHQYIGNLDKQRLPKDTINILDF